MANRLTALDAAFLNTEHPGEPMHVAGLYLFSARDSRTGQPLVPDFERLLAQRLQLVPRYRQRCVSVPLGLGHPVWVDDPDFDLGYHLRRLALPHPGGMRELLDVVARIHERPLDRNRPLWETYVIEGVDGDRYAVYTKVHHAMVDGLSGIDLAVAVYDDSPEGRRLPRPARWEPAALPSRRRLVLDVALETAGAGLGGARATLRHPVATPRRIAAGIAATAAVRRLSGMLRTPPESPFNHAVGPHRRIAVVDVDLRRVKAIKNALGCTVNDVVLAAVGEAVHHHLARRGVRHGDLNYRIMVPVSLRAPSERMTYGNRVAAMFVELPVGPMPAKRRVRLIAAEMKRLKDEHQAAASEELLTMMSWLPPALHALGGPVALEHQHFVNFVVSNVPGMQHPLYADGTRLVETYPLLPVTMNIGMNVCVMSYCDGLYFGLVADRDLVPDLDVLADGLRAGFDRLERAARTGAARSTAPADTPAAASA